MQRERERLRQRKSNIQITKPENEQKIAADFENGGEGEEQGDWIPQIKTKTTMMRRKQTKLQNQNDLDPWKKNRNKYVQKQNSGFDSNDEDERERE